MLILCTLPCVEPWKDNVICFSKKKKKKEMKFNCFLVLFHFAVERFAGTMFIVDDRESTQIKFSVN